MKNAYSVDTLADRWSLHPNTIRRQLRKGELPRPLKIGQQYRWPADVIQAFEQRMMRGEQDAKR